MGGVGAERSLGIHRQVSQRRSTETDDKGATALQELTTGRSHAFSPRHIFEWLAACECG